ncbi:MAG: flagellar biosynthetic protein FliO [Gammaproteobacteria bacterium]|nr:flagellar biosynthetic protein FliO [Gammaproteobacteria bacterium]
MLDRAYQLIVLIALASSSSLSYATASGSVSVNPIIALLKMAFALVVVLVLLWAFTVLLKRLQSPSLRAKNGLELVSTYSVGQRERLVVVQVGEEQLLLGVTSSAISKLHVLPTPLQQLSDEQSGSFKKTLKAAMNREVPA